MRRIIGYFTKSIHRKLLVSFFCISLIPLLILGWLSYANYLKIVENKTYDYNYQMLKTFSEKLENYFNQIEQLSYTVYQENIQQILENENYNRGSINDFDIIRERMDVGDAFKTQMDFYKFSEIINCIIITRNDGSIFYDNSGRVSDGFDFKTQEWFGSIMSRQAKSNILGPHSQPYIAKIPTDGIQQEDKYISYVRKIGSINSANVGLGVIIIDFNVDEIDKILAPLIADEEGSIIVADGRNKPVTSLTSDNSKPADALLANPGFNKSGYFTRKINGVDYFITYYSSSITGWKILCMKKIKNMVKESVQLRYMVIVIMVISFFVVVIVSVLLSYGLVNPLKRLKRTLYQVRDGNLDVKMPRLTNDEIGELGSAYNEMIDRMKHLIEKVLKTQLNEREAQLNALQSQINPHFLYNTLETMVSIACEEGVDKLGDMARALSGMFRYSTRVGGSTVTISDEITHIRNYLDIITVRFEDKFDVDIQIPDELKSYKILKLILQPLVENSIYHGLEMKLGKGKVVIRAERTDKIIKILVHDDGVGMSAERLDELREFLGETQVIDPGSASNGRVGIKNVHDRIRLYFGQEYGITIDSEAGKGTTVMVSIPVVPS